MWLIQRGARHGIAVAMVWALSVGGCSSDGQDTHPGSTGGAGAAAGAGGQLPAGGGSAASGGGGAAGDGGSGGATANGCDPIAQLDFEGDLVDPFGLADTGSAASFVTFVPGRTGLAARSSHNDDDGGDDFTVTLGSLFDQHDELTVRFWVNYEVGYENCDPDGIYNIKLFWTLGAEAHNEVIIQSLRNETASVQWQLSGGGTGWDGGTRITEWASAPYRLGEWMQVEIYMRLSSGSSHLGADGVQRLRLDGQTIIEGTDVVTGVPGRLSSPAIKATCDAPAGHGWWLIDDYEICPGSLL